MDFSTFKPITPDEFKQKHSKTLYRSICVPSTVQAYSLCIEYMKSWFIGKFSPDTFKSIYIEGKNIYDDFRSLTKLELLKSKKAHFILVLLAIMWQKSCKKSLG